ncbi:MAG: hypothetical protein HY906_06245 [Deltaproteobacteria bacterium]|nr:hypothetical protein [Deltaproteobacteria bacterium]
MGRYVVLVGVIGLLGCRGERPREARPPVASATAVTAPAPASAPALASAPASAWAPASTGTIAGGKLDLRAVDFRNVTLPVGPGEGWTIRQGQAVMGGEQGEVTFAEVLFADLDGDGIEEAVVRLIFEGLLGGNNHGDFVNVYGIRGGRLAMLASHTFGNDADTLKSMKIVGRRLVVTGEAHAPDDAVCCPSLHHVSAFELKQGKLVRVARKVSRGAGRGDRTP